MRPSHAESRKDTLRRSIPISTSPSNETKKDPSPLPKPNSLASSDTGNKADFPSKQALPSSNAGSKNGPPSKQNPSSNTENKKDPLPKLNPTPSNTEGKRDPPSTPNSLPSNTESKKDLPSKSNSPADAGIKGDPLSKPKPPSPSVTNGGVFASVNGNRELAMKPIDLSPHPESKSASEQPQQSRADKRNVCINWLRGKCDYDSSTCWKLHDLNAPRPRCTDWRTCHKPVCYYAHEVGKREESRIFLCGLIVYFRRAYLLVCRPGTLKVRKIHRYTLNRDLSPRMLRSWYPSMIVGNVRSKNLLNHHDHPSPSLQGEVKR